MTPAHKIRPETADSGPWATVERGAECSAITAAGSRCERTAFRELDGTPVCDIHRRVLDRGRDIEVVGPRATASSKAADPRADAWDEVAEFVAERAGKHFAEHHDGLAFGLRQLSEEVRARATDIRDRLA